ncbi:hypothetical protein HXX76_009762 [Chlamydomonas incerta]|uniref:Uncharacterized protein n=1 Tax=Chlamydomonas incerta TaxID=51695 RepID=A0A835VZC8_CHLIN|nr:hypothetical protein HXX76_009762 [Chlamydomonas incerta]|eukprot:KAG2431234.1 hypothetical protein HXX76_009762 [Chlamydomonas incerta]
MVEPCEGVEEDFPRKLPWSEAEDEAIVYAHAQLGNKWSQVSKLIPGRTENDIKNRWHSTVRGRNITRSSPLLPVYARAVAPHCDDPEARRAALQRALQYKQQLQQEALMQQLQQELEQQGLLLEEQQQDQPEQSVLDCYSDDSNAAVAAAAAAAASAAASCSGGCPAGGVAHTPHAAAAPAALANPMDVRFGVCCPPSGLLLPLCPAATTSAVGMGCADMAVDGGGSEEEGGFVDESSKSSSNVVRAWARAGTAGNGGNPASKRRARTNPGMLPAAFMTAAAPSPKSATAAAAAAAGHCSPWSFPAGLETSPLAEDTVKLSGTGGGPDVRPDDVRPHLLLLQQLRQVSQTAEAPASPPPAVQQPQAAATMGMAAEWRPTTPTAPASAPFCGLAHQQPLLQVQQLQQRSVDAAGTSAAAHSRLKQLVACSGYPSALQTAQEPAGLEPTMALCHAATAIATAIASAHIGGPTPPLASQHPSQQPPQAAALAAALAAAAAAASCGGGGGGGLCFDALDVLLDQIDKMDAAMLAGIGPVSEAAAGEQGGLIDDALMAELLGPAPAEPQPAAQIQQMPVQVVDVMTQQHAQPLPASGSSAGACWPSPFSGPQGTAAMGALPLGGLPARPNSAFIGSGGGGDSSSSCFDIFEAAARRGQPAAAVPPLPPLRTSSVISTSGGVSGPVCFYTPSNTPTAAAKSTARTFTCTFDPCSNSTILSLLLAGDSRCGSTDPASAASAGQQGQRSRLGLFAAGGAGTYSNSSSALAYPAGDGVVVTDAHCTLGLGEADMQQVLEGVAGGGGEDMMEL